MGTWRTKYNYLIDMLDFIKTKDFFMLSGAHCTGKSTILGDVQQIWSASHPAYSTITKFDEFRDLKVIPSGVENIKKDKNLSLIESQILLFNITYLTVLQVELAKVDKPTLFLADRGIVDTYIYSLYFHRQGKIPDSHISYLRQLIENWMDLKPVTKLFITTIDNIPFDSTRKKFSLDEDSRKVINDYFLEFYESYKDRCFINLLPSDRHERITTLFNSLSPIVSTKQNIIL